MIADNLTTFAGAPVRDYDGSVGIEDPKGVAYRLALNYDAFDKGVTIASLFDAFVEDPKAPELERLVVGAWDFESSESSATIVQAIVSRPDRFVGLRHFFLGDIVAEEQEISWIQQSDITPIFGALPDLVELVVRGSDGLAIDGARHDRLEKLVIETGGLRPNVVEGVAAADFPRLKHLELWLGDSSYGFEGSCIDLLAPILAGERFPRLEYLGLKNCEEQDTVARLVAEAPIVDRLEVLDLSMGTLSDDGAGALASSSKLGALKKLDLHYHFMTEVGISKLLGLGIDVDVSDRQEPDDYKGETFRYVAVSE